MKVQSMTGRGLHKMGVGVPMHCSEQEQPVLKLQVVADNLDPDSYSTKL